VKEHGDPATQSLPTSFYRRRSIAVARDLLGCHLVRRVGRSTTVIEITETEAYLGAVDPASHAAFGRRTQRVEPMYGPAGFAYIYFVYGMHWCCNVVCATEGVADAVLVRAGIAIEGRATMLKRRHLKEQASDKGLAGGPAKLCQAMAIDGKLNNYDLQGPSLFLAPGRNVAEAEVLREPRVGVDYAGRAKDWPLRYRVSLSPRTNGPLGT